MQIPKEKPWVAILRPDVECGGFTFAAPLSASEDSLMRLRYAWAGFAPFANASYAESLVSAHLSGERNAHNDAGSALRQAMSAAIGVQEQFMRPTERRLMIRLPVLVTAGKLVGAKLNSTGDTEIEDLSHVFVSTPGPHAQSMIAVHVMTADYFTESFAPGLDSSRRAKIF